MLLLSISLARGGNQFGDVGAKALADAKEAARKKLKGQREREQAKEAKKVAKAEAKEAKRRKSSAKATDSTSPLHAKREIGRERSGSTNRKMVI